MGSGLITAVYNAESLYMYIHSHTCTHARDIFMCECIKHTHVHVIIKMDESLLLNYTCKTTGSEMFLLHDF